MRGSEKQVKWAKEIEAEVRGYWASLEAKFRGEWEDPEGAEEVRSEFKAVMEATAPYQDSAAWWIEVGRDLTSRGAVRSVMHRVTVYPETLERYL
jgi:hypothetical protein